MASVTAAVGPPTVTVTLTVLGHDPPAVRVARGVHRLPGGRLQVRAASGVLLRILGVPVTITVRDGKVTYVRVYASAADAVAALEEEA